MFDHQLDRALRALASTNRRWMMERLADSDVSLSELAEVFPMSLTAVIQHVQVLERCKLVSTQKVGRVRICRLEPDTLFAVEIWLRRTLSASRRDSRRSLPQDWALLGAFERPEGR